MATSNTLTKNDFINILEQLGLGTLITESELTTLASSLGISDERLYSILDAVVGRLTNTIKVQKTTAKQITWSSTSNPYFCGEFDVSMSGYFPVAVGYEIGGTQGSLVCISALAVRGNKVAVEARMHNGTPSTTTQNTIYLTVTYLKTALLGGA